MNDIIDKAMDLYNTVAEVGFGEHPIKTEATTALNQAFIDYFGFTLGKILMIKYCLNLLSACTLLNKKEVNKDWMKEYTINFIQQWVN